ncbi:hypothetical protein DFJ77DRAFT_288192 [Powellomyces hirtus]|nr:hypothetical protein DFJ77DRAFT_288192 [Powellomyces hirtus]
MVQILVIGGSFGGMGTAQKLETLLTKAKKEFTITLVTEQDSFYYVLGGMRAVVEEGYGEKLYIPYDKAFKTKNVTVIQGKVTSLTAKEATLANGTTIAFDYLVLATGSQNSGGKSVWETKAEGIKMIGQRTAALRKANSVLIVGGGPSAVELAGEIKTDLPSKSVTIVHSGPDLIPGISPKFSAKVKNELLKMGVTIISNDRIEPDTFGPQSIVESTRTLKTVNNLDITSDIQYLLVGNAKYNSEVAVTLDPSLIDEKKQIKVTPTLQLADDRFKHIFAVGDVTNMPGIKLAYTTGQQADIAAANIKKLIDGNSTKLSTFTPASSAIMLVTIGRKNGVVQLPFGTFGGWMATPMKSSHLFLPKYYTMLNAVLAK